jgi:hypothetical protein
MIGNNEKQDVIESLKLVRAISLKAAIDGDYRIVAGMEVIKNCLYELGCILETEGIINRHLANEYLEECFKLK